MSDVTDQVQHIANMLTNGFGDELNHDGEQMSAFDYLQDVLEIEYIVNSKKEYLGARLLVAFGGPNIWVDTAKALLRVSGGVTVQPHLSWTTSAWMMLCLNCSIVKGQP